MNRCLLGLALVAMIGTSVMSADDKLKVKVGDAFPVVALTAAQVEKAKPSGGELSIADLKGKNVVVFFYPRASTSGCTVESCGFRDLAAKFPKDTVLIGASNDKLPAQEKFIKDHNLPFALLCDPEQTLINALGISNGKAAQRKTFVVGKDGKIAKIYEKVTPKDHPAEVLKFLEEISK
jgi:peroxiredoxin Q/BCP